MVINKRRFEVERAKSLTTMQNIMDQTGLSAATLAKISKGEAVSTVSVGKIASALGVSVEDLIEDGD